MRPIPTPVAGVLIQEQLSSAIGSRRGAEAADSLCIACVQLLSVDAAAISLVFDGTNSGTLGASSAEARVFDELQFTFGEGPCLDSVATRKPVLVADLATLDERRWPAYAPAMLTHHTRSVFAMPVVLAGQYVGALDLYRGGPRMLNVEELDGALAAAVFAELPLLDLLTAEVRAAVDDDSNDAWSELAALTRTEIAQATGMLVAQLDIGPTEALVRLRAHAFASNRSATDVARDILDHGLRLESDQ